MRKKEQLREQCKLQRRGMTAEEVQQLSVEISDRLLTSELYQRAEKVFFFYPLGKEVSLLAAAQQALRERKQVAFPKVHGDDMTFYVVKDLKQFEPGAFGIMEPVSTEIADWQDALVLVPGLGFDRTGGRIGYGKGYYDRYCEPRSGLCMAGIAYGWQILEDIPCEPQDVALQYLITEKEIIRCGL
ncbi:MAG: 5-formyltetrahydrofolate cyclo-ligase [Roseburia sp.]